MLTSTKESLKKEFSKNWEKYYKIDFLVEQGFKRKVCKKCGKGFWTLDEQRDVCPDQPCSDYEFLGNPPTKKRFEYVEAWKAIEKFFIKHGHESIPRYPVVARWFPPLFFTVASIVDFYRIDNGNVVFEFPANPLIVPQFCLRFNDVPNVGVTGKHYTSFVMVGQHSLYDGKNGYWKEKCIELDYKMLTEVFGIPPEEIVFVEDLWLGSGAFGYSMEYFVRGLELGNAVFTEFLITPSGPKEMKEKVIDMGAGLERFPWVTNGTPTSYDVVFKPVIKSLLQTTGLEYEKDLFLRYSKYAGMLNVDEVRDVEKIKRLIAEKLGVETKTLEEKIEPIQALYAIADHTRALSLAITDGQIPSNVGGGYNLRVVLRRALSFIDEFRWDFQLIDVCELHAKQLKQLVPELEEHLDEIQEILEVETKRYRASKERARQIVRRIVEAKKEIDEQTLINLYDSHGITPEMVRKFAPHVRIPPDFYSKVAERHSKPVEKKKEVLQVDVSGLPPTKKLFYERDYDYEFEARVVKIIGNKVVLDQTLFYPTSGGQEHDTGYLNGVRVTDVEKIGDVILHTVERVEFKEGDIVKGIVDKERREALRKHHTATHIINAAARKVLGSWVWQAGAEKKVDKARLDVTHYESLTEEQVEKIENLANEIVKKDLPVRKFFIPRVEAEKKYGFRIYQGGAVPSKTIRIVEIEGVDVEACGGMHCNSTGEVGFTTILSTERIQDGVVRIEFTCGENAIKILEEKERILNSLAELLGVEEESVPDAVKKLFEEWKRTKKEVEKLKTETSEVLVKRLSNSFKQVNGIKYLVVELEGFTQNELREVGNKLVSDNSVVVLLGILDRVYVFVKAGKDVVSKGFHSGKFCKELTQAMEGKGGGSESIAEGFGVKKLSKDEIERMLARRMGG
ncbi:MAG: alanine--tRNA ligase [Candidatus Aenigmarchaeota archaeon]|nr:alanine--tRNA ligase [Candidatus Aenigmarchaeota archaeon]